MASNGSLDVWEDVDRVLGQLFMVKHSPSYLIGETNGFGRWDLREPQSRLKSRS